MFMRSVLIVNARSASEIAKRANEMQLTCELLLQLNPAEHEFPYCVDLSERPDVLLQSKSKRIGLEITFAATEEYRRAQALHRRGRFSQRVITTTNLVVTDRRRASQELVAEMLDPQSPPMEHERGMALWAEKLRAAIMVKREKLNQPDFQRFDENWLLIEDEPGLPSDQWAFDSAWDLLLDLFGSLAPLSVEFDRIFIHSDQSLFICRDRRLCHQFWEQQGLRTRFFSA
jgi:hypothetical protein